MKLIDYLSSEDGTERMVSECLKFVDESDGIIAFGAGIGGEWDTRTTLYFDENPGTSTITDVGGNAVKAITIDDLLLDEDPVTIVKMDIEGAEANALVGARKLIKEDKPILAICVYHKRDDYYHLLDIIKDICPNEYSFYFRQYRYTPTETVCYAIPKNRKIKT